MNLKRLIKKIFVSGIGFFKDGINFYLKSYEQSYKLDLYHIKRIKSDK